MGSNDSAQQDILHKNLYEKNMDSEKAVGMSVRLIWNPTLF